MDISFEKKVENYCKNRKKIGETEDFIYLEEVDFICPLCGKHLYRKGEKKTNKDYQIAHIFPNSPTKEDLRDLDGVELLGNDSESFDNKIALCKDCHWDFDQNKSKEKYNKLIEKKKKVKTKRDVKVEISNINIEQELFTTIDWLLNIKPIDLGAYTPLSYDALEIKQKIEDEDILLRNDIESNVRSYYVAIDNKISNLCKTTGSNMELVASAIRQSYLKSQKNGMTKTQIFESLCNWISSKTSCNDIVARIIISYFVQHCEVYDKIS